MRRIRVILKVTVWVYFVVTFVAITVWVGFGTYVGIDLNKDGMYCDYYSSISSELAELLGLPPNPRSPYVREGEANWTAQGDPCRLRIWNILSEFGAVYIIILVFFQWPAYLYFVVAHMRKKGAIRDSVLK